MASDEVIDPHWKSKYTFEEFALEGTESLVRVPITGLNIIWGNDPRFWRLNYIRDENRGLNGFTQGALLVQVNWIEVTGKLPMEIFRKTSFERFEIYYVVNFRDDAFGWHSAPIKFKVRVDAKETDQKIKNLEQYQQKHDKWHEIPGGQFSVSKTAESVEFGMYEVETAWWKGSMVLAGVKIKPMKDHKEGKEISKERISDIALV